MPSLVHFSLDPFSRRLRLSLAEYGVPVELIDEEPWEPSPEIFELNPAGTLPVYLEDSATALCGIEAIGEYLEETKSTRIPLIPGGVLERAEVRRLVGWFDGKFYAEVSEPVLTEKLIRRGGPATARVRRAMTLLRDPHDYTGHLADHRPWLAGDRLSLADLAAAAHISSVDYFGDIPWSDYPVAKSWYQRVKSRPSFRPPLADPIRWMSPVPH